MRCWTRAKLTKQKQTANDRAAFLLELKPMIVMVAMLFCCNESKMPGVYYAKFDSDWPCRYMYRTAYGSGLMKRRLCYKVMFSCLPRSRKRDLPTVKGYPALCLTLSLQSDDHLYYSNFSVFQLSFSLY